jgi:polyhydroxyalkanoate synthesis regulator phasin
MWEAKVTRRMTYTYDNRDKDTLIAQLHAEVEALRRRVREMEGKR